MCQHFHGHKINLLKHAWNNKYFATAKEFRHQINHFFDRALPSIADSLNERINDNFQVLSSAS
jgi:hypothetical protein